MLDLFAGSGAMGLEALSRGAASVTFVESDRAACRTIAENLERLRLTGARVTCGDALWTLRQRVADVRPRPRRSALRGVGGAGAEARGAPAEACSRPDGLVVVETGVAHGAGASAALRTSRRYGSARLTLFEPSR